jgi:hypothetical protein
MILYFILEDYLRRVIKQLTKSFEDNQLMYTAKVPEVPYYLVMPLNLLVV